MREIENELEKNCTYCNTAYTANRIDQKFCRNRCRYRFNNHLRRKREQERKGINNMLKKNHVLLKKLLSTFKSQRKYSAEQLKRWGFSFDFFTQMSTDNGEVVIGIYNYTLVQGKDGLYKIEKEEKL